MTFARPALKFSIPIMGSGTSGAVDNTIVGVVFTQQVDIEFINDFREIAPYDFFILFN